MGRPGLGGLSDDGGLHAQALRDQVVVTVPTASSGGMYVESRPSPSSERMSTDAPSLTALTAASHSFLRAASSPAILEVVERREARGAHRLLHLLHVSRFSTGDVTLSCLASSSEGES